MSDKPEEKPVERLAMTVAQAAEVLGISRTHAYACARNGELPTVWLGKRMLVPVKALEALLVLPNVTAQDREVGRK